MTALNKEADRKVMFPFLLGQVMGMVSTEDVRQHLRDHAVTDGEIDAFEKASFKLAEGFYREKGAKRDDSNGEGEQTDSTQ